MIFWMQATRDVQKALWDSLTFHNYSAIVSVEVQDFQREMKDVGVVLGIGKV